MQHYISSSWYDNPNAPTWNYLSVHIVGRISVIEGQALWDSVSRLTDRYEQQFARCPVALDALPVAVQKQVQGIVGFEITLDQVQASFKMSQNRHANDYQNIIQELHALQTPAARPSSCELPDSTPGKLPGQSKSTRLLAGWPQCEPR